MATTFSHWNPPVAGADPRGPRLGPEAPQAGLRAVRERGEEGAEVRLFPP